MRTTALAPLRSYTPNVKAEKPTLTVSEFADRVGVTERSVWRWIKSGKLDFWKIGGVTRIPLTALTTAQGASL